MKRVKVVYMPGLAPQGFTYEEKGKRSIYPKLDLILECPEELADNPKWMKAVDELFKLGEELDLGEEKPKTADGITLNKTLEIYELLNKTMNLLIEMAGMCFDRIKERRKSGK